MNTSVFIFRSVCETYIFMVYSCSILPLMIMLFDTPKSFIIIIHVMHLYSLMPLNVIYTSLKVNEIRYIGLVFLIYILLIDVISLISLYNRLIPVFHWPFVVALHKELRDLRDGNEALPVE